MKYLHVKQCWMVLLFVATPFLSRSQQILSQFSFSAKSIQINHSVSDAEGNLVVCGYFYGNSANLNGTLINVLHPVQPQSGHRVTGFVAKLRKNGTVQWALPIHNNRINVADVPGSIGYKLDAETHTLAQYVATSPNGDVYVAGKTASDTLTMSGSTIVIPRFQDPNIEANRSNVFISKISATGNLDWLKVWTGEVLYLNHLEFKQNRLNCLVRGRIERTLPTPGFVSQSPKGIRMVSMDNTGTIQSEQIIVGNFPTNRQWASTFPTYPNQNETEFYVPITYDTIMNISLFNSCEKGIAHKYNSSGQLVAEEKTKTYWPESHGIFGITNDQTGGFFVSHGMVIQGDTTSFFQNSIQVPSPGSSSFFLHKFSSDGCKEWSRRQKGVLYDLVTDSEGSVYGLTWDTTNRDGIFANHALTFDFSPFEFVPRSKRFPSTLVKFNRRGSKVFEMPLTIYEAQDSLKPWEFVFGLNGPIGYRSPVAPITITRIKNDTITLAGGKFICHIKDLSVDSVFSTNPVNCNPIAFFKPLVLANREERNASDFTLAPNPVQSTLSIRMPEKEGDFVQLRITDLLGKTIFSQEVRNFSGRETLDLQAIPSGVYLFQMDLEGQKVTRKFLKE